MILEHQFLASQSNVPKKPLAYFEILNYAACVRRQVKQRIVSPARLKFFTKSSRPILSAHLPAIHVQHSPAATGILFSRFNFFYKLANKFFEMGIKICRIKLITFKSKSGNRCRSGNCAIISRSKSHDGPITGWNIPFNSSIRLKPVCEINNFLFFDRCAGWGFRIICNCRQEWFNTLSRRVRSPVIESFFVNIFNLNFCRGGWKG